jgi:uncharacterized membrane protein
MGKLKQFWADLRSSLWFLPLLILIGMVALAFELIDLDQYVHGSWAREWPRFFAADPDGSRAMLSAIAGSMITVAGVVFSITIVALAQASSQFSPRVLRNFMRDRGNQVVLGAFVGVFAYCLVVLRNITGGRDNGFVPSLAILVGFLLSLVAIGFLIFFIHHIATSIQASEMVAAISGETIEVLQAMFPDNVEPAAPPAQKPPPPSDQHWHSVPSLATGYIQRVETARLHQLACRHNVYLRMESGVGDFAVVGHPLASISGPEPTPALVQGVNANYGIDSYRTVDQDPGFGIRQIVDIALKALSPGINDTGTAMTCVDYLSAIFSTLASLDLQARPPLAGPAARLIPKTIKFEKLVGDACEQILHSASGNKAVLIHLLRGLERVGGARCHPARRPFLLLQIDAIVEVAERTINVPSARQAVIERAQTLKKCLSSCEGLHKSGCTL